MSVSTYRLSQFFVASVLGLIIINGIPQLSAAQDLAQNEVISFRLDIDGPDNEWIRIERSGNLLRLIHTTRSARRDGVGGVANFLLDAVGPSDIAFSDWDDHQTTRILFEPDYCSLNSADRTIPVIRPPSTSSNCVVIGTDTLILPEGLNVYQGQFTLEYIERELLRTVTFRVPEDENF